MSFGELVIQWGYSTSTWALHSWSGALLRQGIDQYQWSARLMCVRVEKRGRSCSAQFFALPLAAKQRMDNRNSRHWRGYIELGRENTQVWTGSRSVACLVCRLLTAASANAQGKPDWREQVEFGVEQQPVDGAFGADRPLWERLIGVTYVKRCWACQTAM